MVNHWAIPKEGVPEGRRWIRPSTLPILISVGIVIVLSLPIEVNAYQAAESIGAASQLTPAQLGFMTHIDHIIFVVLENHAYDNYFGTYCTVKSSLCPFVANGIPPGTCVPKNPAVPSAGCVKPFNFTAANWSTHDMGHFYTNSEEAWNHGSMNGFYIAERSGCTTCGIGLNPFGHYNGTTAPIYWDLAEEFSLDDNFFSSTLDYSLPNHWHIVAGQAPQVVLENATSPPPDSVTNVSRVVSTDHLYLNESNHTESVEDLLLNSSVSWKYYDFTLGQYGKAIKIALNADRTQIESYGTAYAYFNPQAAKAESYNISFAEHFVPNQQFYWDAHNGTLPDISWVIPPGQDSDHPPDNSTLAQGWLASVVDAVEASPDWNTTAMFITWDDYGGFYDHVDPPAWESQQLGFRVPLLVVSPWVDKGYVDSTMGFFESVLHLMEWRFKLGCISVLDCSAPLPLGAFDWKRPVPRTPIMFPTNESLASYPFNPKWNGPAVIPYGTYYPPTQYVVFPDGEAPDID